MAQEFLFDVTRVHAKVYSNAKAQKAYSGCRIFQGLKAKGCPKPRKPKILNSRDMYEDNNSNQE